MIGSKYIVKKDYKVHNLELKQGDVLTEIEAYNFETETYEDGGTDNSIVNDNNEFICDVGSKFAEENLELC